MKRPDPFEIRPVPPEELPALPELTPEIILERTPAGGWRQRLVQVCILGASLAPCSLLAAEPADAAPETEDAGQDVQTAEPVGAEPDYQVVGCMCAPAPGSGQATWAASVAALLALLATRRAGS